MMTVQSQKIWKAGVALSDAWLYFAADPVRSDHKSKAGFAGALQRLKDIVENTRDGKLILSALQTAGQAHLEEIESRKPLQEALLETLASDGLVATGYSAVQANGEAVLIDPQALATADPDWENSRILVNDTIYEKVRVTDPRALREKPARPAEAANVATIADIPVTADVLELSDVAPAPGDVTVAPKPSGRTIARANILSALENLVEQDSAFGDLTRKSAAQLIRDAIGAAYEKGNGLSDPNLARYIRRTCGPKTKVQA